jgi:hypothetical protein
MHCVGKVQFCDIRAGGTYSNHCALILLQHHDYFIYHLLYFQWKYVGLSQYVNIWYIVVISSRVGGYV